MEEEFGIGIETQLSFEQAVMKTRVALRAKGFGILSEMPAPPNIGETTGRKHLFLSVWQQIISTANLGGQGLDLGDHLPVSVVVFEEGDQSVVAVLDPITATEGWDEAAEARAAIEKVLEEVAGE